LIFSSIRCSHPKSSCAQASLATCSSAHCHNSADSILSVVTLISHRLISNLSNALRIISIIESLQGSVQRPTHGEQQPSSSLNCLAAVAKAQLFSG
jgi:hypothetical protein